MTGRWVSPVGHDRTRSVINFHEWNLTGSDRMLGSYIQSWQCAAFGHLLTVGIGRLVFEERDDVAAIR